MCLCLYLCDEGISLNDWLLKHSGEDFDLAERQSVGQQVLLLLTAMHGHESVSLWGGFTGEGDTHRHDDLDFLEFYFSMSDFSDLSC